MTMDWEPRKKAIKKRMGELSITNLVVYVLDLYFCGWLLQLAWNHFFPIVFPVIPKLDYWTAVWGYLFLGFFPASSHTKARIFEWQYWDFILADEEMARER